MKKLLTVFVIAFFTLSLIVPLARADDDLSDCTLDPAFYKDNVLQSTNANVPLTSGSTYRLRVIVSSSGSRCLLQIYWKVTLLETIPSDNPNEPADTIDHGTLPGGSGVINSSLPFQQDINLGDAGLNHTYSYTLHISDDPNFQAAYHYKTNSITFVQATGGGSTGNNNKNANSANGNKANSNGNNTSPTTIANNSYQNYDSVTANLSNPLNAGSIPELITRLIRILLLLIAMVAVVMIIVGGFRMVASQGSPDAIAKGRKTITWAIIGLVVALLSFSIVAIIQNLIQTK